MGKMPKPKRKFTSQKHESILKKDDSINLTLDVDSKVIDHKNFKLDMWKVEVKDKMKSTLSKLNDVQKQKLEAFEQDYNNLLMAIPNNVLDASLDINSEVLRNFILGIETQDHVESEKNSTIELPPSTVKRRSRSVNPVKCSKRSGRLRSTSADVYKTPKGRMRLSSIMTHKKYTVTKPAKPENTGLNVKRVMKPDEMAISTCGSPLYVAPCSVGTPHVNIPLPGGVVLNIEPKEPRGSFEIPGLDAKTRSQIKLLCEQMKKLF